MTSRAGLRSVLNAAAFVSFLSFDRALANSSRDKVEEFNDPSRCFHARIQFETVQTAATAKVMANTKRAGTRPTPLVSAPISARIPSDTNSVKSVEKKS